MTARLEGRTAIVIGAGSVGARESNGSAAALTFAREGARVLCVDRVPAAAEGTAERIHRAGGSAAAFHADVQSAEQLEAAVAHCVRQWDTIDVLHYNVGIEELGGLTELTDDSWERVHAVNLTGAMRAARAVVPHMLRQRRGSIIHMSSLASLRWGPTQYLSYSTSKAALNQLTKIVARQYAPYGVRCNAIVAGMIDTPHVEMLLGGAEEIAKGHALRNAACPMGRQGTPWDIANAALFLASDESAYVTGLEMIVDGGLSL